MFEKNYLNKKTKRNEKSAEKIIKKIKSEIGNNKEIIKNNIIFGNIEIEVKIQKKE